MDPLVLEFVENLRREREKAGLKQREVAEMLNLNRSTYSYYENLNRPHMPDIDIICKIADIFGCSVSALLPRDKNTIEVHSPESCNPAVCENSEEEKLLKLFRSCSDDDKKKLMMNALNFALDKNDDK